MFILGTIGIIAIITGVMLLMRNEKPIPKNENKPRRRSVWDDDPFFGTPLQKIY